jgi:psiF repeat.
MKAIITALCLVLVSAPAGYAQQKSQDTGKPSAKAPSEKQTAQRERMKACNDQAAGKKGDERKKFMSACLSEDTAKPPTAQQQRMKECNREASDKGMKGDARQKFMSTCLKGG